MRGQFNGEAYPLGVGKVRLARRWFVHQGQLGSSSMPYLWTPGVNTARCPMYSFAGMVLQMAMPFFGIRGTPAYDHNNADWPGLPGKCTRTDCPCGFYGYFEPHLEYVGSVDGIIEGWGRSVIGSKGAQVEKAQVVALAPNPGYVDYEEMYKSVVEMDPRTVWQVATRQRPYHYEHAAPMKELGERYDVPVYPVLAQAIEDYPLGEVT